ncbi:Os11g0623601 [Oryza sativa Japonica Group]|uniref:Os11g0623601 protein n=1 Tax=Oryza sativa subsp. japonica TaxID=39947 RepID=A0A0P0Y4G2_ORYSJ|nr:Os11g0623601 [Oryza sativa Japonica Group]
MNAEMSVLIVHLVGSALGGPYLSLVAALNGFAGPLHGMSNQEVLLWIKPITGQIGSDIRTDLLKECVENTKQWKDCSWLWSWSYV